MYATFWDGALQHAELNSSMMQVRSSFRKVAKAKKPTKSWRTSYEKISQKQQEKVSTYAVISVSLDFCFCIKKVMVLVLIINLDRTKSKQQRNLHPKWKYGHILGKHQVKDSLLKDSASSDTSPFSIIQTVFKTIVITDILGCLFPSFTKTLPQR